MSERKEVRYADKCGQCGELWVSRKTDYEVIPASEAGSAVVKCRCGATWMTTDRLAGNL